MPTKREREYYARGFQDGARWFEENLPAPREYRPASSREEVRQRAQTLGTTDIYGKRLVKPKRKLSAWNKFVKANAKKPRFRLRSGAPNLKKLAVAFRKTKRNKR
jgi:hypothetical protein